MWRRALFLLLLPAKSLCLPAHADDVRKTAVKAFDYLCVSPQLNERRIRVNAATLKSAEIPKDKLEMMGGGDFGLWVRIDERLVIVVLAHKVLDGRKYPTCAVTVKDMSKAEAREAIEANFPVKLRDQFKQGVSELFMYSAELAGFAKDMAIGIQQAEGIATFSLFEVPR